MKHDFDKRIKNLLEDASIADTGFELNKNAVWSHIQSKQKTKIIPFQKWISHAAAVIVGVLLCLPFLLKKEKTTERTVTIVKAIATPAQVIRDTIFIKQPLANPVKANNTRVRQEIRYVYEKPAGSELQPNKASSKSIENPVTNNLPSTIAFASPSIQKNKVLHLLDMDNENSTPLHKKNNNYKLFHKIAFPSNPDDKSETFSMLAGIQLSN